MIKRNASNCVKVLKIVLVRTEVSMPSYNIKNRMFHLGCEELSLKLIDDCKRLVNIFIPRNWVLKVSWVSRSISSNGSKIWDDKSPMINFNNPSSSIAVDLDCKFDTSWHHSNFFRLDL